MRNGGHVTRAAPTSANAQRLALARARVGYRAAIRALVRVGESKGVGVNADAALACLVSESATPLAPEYGGALAFR